MIKTLRPYLKGYGKYLLLCMFVMMFEGILEMMLPYFMSQIVNVGVMNKDLGFVIQKGLIMVSLALGSLLAGILGAVLSSKGGMGFGSQLRKALFDKIQTFSFSNIDHFSTASLVTRTTADVNNIQNMVMMLCRMAVRSPIMMITAMYFAMQINRELVLVFFCVVPILGFSLFFIVIKSFPLFGKMLEKYDGLNASTQENLNAIRVVKAFVRDTYEKAKFKLSNDALMEAALKAEKMIILNMPIMQLCTYICVISILWFGGNLVMDGEMLTGDLMAFITYINNILMSLMMLSMIFVNILISSASLKRITEVLNEEIDINDKPSNSEYPVQKGSIEFRDVNFSYKNDMNTLVLKDINVKIEAGETIGIIGGTGSSKSSFVQLIPRLYDVTSGKIMIDGRDVRDIKIETLRDSVSMVLQKNVLFSGTILENLRWGDLNASDEECIAACKVANAHNFIMEFPDGYNTHIEQGGTNVSGGQKQRLCIARALLKKPKILILDDSTSAVDTATDASIRKELKENLKDMTTLIIAQRISSVQDADRIIVFDNGKINDVGTHDELLSRNPIYQEVYTSQMKGVVGE